MTNFSDPPLRFLRLSQYRSTFPSTFESVWAVNIARTDLRSLLFDSWWALTLIGLTNSLLTVGLLASGLVHGVVPAGITIAGRGLINAFVKNVNNGTAAMEQMIPWLGVGFMLTMLEATIPSAQKFLPSG
ncbi:MAG TPA: hypothetical protein VIB79_29320 [Candidatus Binatia bacterium]|jgi:hypothetical protein